MKAVLVIDGVEIETGQHACLYRGLHDTTDQADRDFHHYLIRHYQQRGWVTMLTLSFLVERKPET